MRAGACKRNKREDMKRRQDKTKEVAAMKENQVHRDNR